MAGGFQFYYEAARALWNMPTNRLQLLAKEAESPARRRAAATAIRLKGEFMAPQAFANEHSAVTKLAAALSDDREFTMDMALRMAGTVPKSSAAALVQSGVARRSKRSTMMWIAVTAGILLLVMDVLATAGLPVPTPIGDLIDRYSGSDESPVTPAPPPPPESRGLIREPDSILGTRAVADPEGRGATAPTLHVRGPTSDDRPKKNPNRANGRERNHANGKERNQANGTHGNPSAVRRASNRPDTGRASPPPERGRPDGAGPPREKGPPRHAGRNGGRPGPGG